MTDDGWKQSAVMFYAAGTIITIVSFIFCIVLQFVKNAERRRNVQKICCRCFITDPMVAYDTVDRNEDSPTEEDELLADDEIEINIHGGIEMKNNNNPI